VTSYAQSVPPRNPATTAATLAWLAERLWVKEATARPGNDGPAVAAIIQAGGGAPAQHPEWCGFTQAADQLAQKLPIPKNGMQGAARAWFWDPVRTYFLAGVRGTVALVMPGDLVGFDYGRGIHHIARAKQTVPNEIKSRPPRGFYTLAGNEGRYPTAGLHLTYYPAVNIDAGARWDY